MLILAAQWFPTKEISLFVLMLLLTSLIEFIFGWGQEKYFVFIWLSIDDMVEMWRYRWKQVFFEFKVFLNCHVFKTFFFF